MLESQRVQDIFTLDICVKFRKSETMSDKLSIRVCFKTGL